ncbi:MAG: ferrous iron transport protein B [Eubacteriaceae bacterium]
MTYTIALAGNPNSGKTTLFNALTGSKQHVGNWPGVTVEKKEGSYKKNKEINLVDLPGTYSLSPYSVEEIVARDFIVKEKPDAVINIVDGTTIERNLYLSLQILETHIPMVIAINMMDEVESHGDRIDCQKISQVLGIPVIPIVAKTGKGIEELMNQTTQLIQNGQKREILDVFDQNIENTLEKIAGVLEDSEDLEKKWIALKLLENDEIIERTIHKSQNDKIQEIIAEAEKKANDDLEAKIADLRYQFIGNVIKIGVHKHKKGYQETRSDKIDKVLTNRFLALPIFAIIMYFLFSVTFSENFLFIDGLPSPGVWFAGLVEELWGMLAVMVERLLESASPWILSLVMNGIIEGLGAIVGFIPLVLVLYLMLSFLEDSGYMARVAFVMDRLFRKFGLSGRAFIPLLMGFGCGVPAIMATRTLDSEKDRKITTIITGFMPCGAKLPIFALFVATFFATENKTLVTYSLYVLSIVVAIAVSLILNKFVYHAAPSNFVMELPQYRIPTLKSVGIHGWEKVKDFAIKAGTIIFASTILIWMLSSFNLNSFNGINKSNSQESSILCEMNDSFLASGGKVIAPIFKPLGFGEWRPAVAIGTGWIAKEMVVVTLAQLYNEDLSPEYLEVFFGKYSGGELEEFGFTEGRYDPLLAPDIYAEVIMVEGGDEHGLLSLKKDISTKSGAYAYMVFNLLCMPCFAAVGAIKRELKTWRLVGFAVCIQMGTAYIVAFLINNLGLLLF